MQHDTIFVKEVELEVVLINDKVDHVNDNENKTIIVLDNDYKIVANIDAYDANGIN